MAENGAGLFGKAGMLSFSGRAGRQCGQAVPEREKNCVILAFFSVLRNEEGSLQGLRKKVLRKTSSFLRGKASRRH
jgi:hypothetical protein